MYSRPATRLLLTTAALAALAAGTAGAAGRTSGGLPADELARRIDDALDARLRAENVRPGGTADDAEFLRRASLDLTGRVPPAAKVVEFLADRSPDKRARLVDELLASDAFGRHLADVWEALLVARNSDNRLVNFEPLRAWLEKEFNAGRPWDALVRDLVTADGTPDENGAVVWFLANQTVDRITDNATKVFLGVQLQCAQCHNHPFTKWKQDDYWGVAAFFLKVQARQPGPMMVAKGETGAVRELPFPRGKRGLPDSARIVPAKFPGGPEARLGPREPRRPALAAWLTAPDNPYFSRATVNRVWSQLFGRGFVNPVDDLRDDNAASHPELLDDLAKEFAAGGYDLKGLFRALCNTRAYQRTSKAAGGKADAPPELFARMSVRVLTPEELFDSLTQVLGNPAGPGGRPRDGKGPKPGLGGNGFGKGVFGNGAGKGAFGKGGLAKGALGNGGLGGGALGKALAAKEGMDNKEAMESPDAKKDPLKALRQQLFSPRNVFVAFFKTEDDDPTEYQAGIPQALRLMNAPVLNNAIATSPLVRPGKPVPQAVQDLYLATVSRRPTPYELQRAVAYIGRQPNPRQGLSDVLWALLNSSEFSMNH